MKSKEFIFCAIDFSDLDESKIFISKIIDHIGGVKIGLEFFLKNGPNGVNEIKKLGLPLFLDLKLNDIPNTCISTIKAIKEKINFNEGIFCRI